MLGAQAVVAAGLERYRAEHRSYPEALEALVPKYLDKVPADLVKGRPLKYQRRENGEYVLYSVGWNGEDDLAPLLANPNAPVRAILLKKAADGDWAWRGIPENVEKSNNVRAQK